MRLMVVWRSAVLQQLFCDLREWSEKCGAEFMQNKINCIPKMHLKIAYFSGYFIKNEDLVAS